ncbi:MAG: hypothetical protein ACTTKZ_02170 [Bacteroides sp.]
MRNVLVFFVALLLATEVFAQTTFELAGYQITPPKNKSLLRRGKKKAIEALGTPVLGRYFLIAQFDAIPSSEVLEKLKAEGIKVQDYLADRTYYISIPEDKVRVSVKGTGIVSLMPVSWEWKTSKLLLGDSIPSFAQKGGKIGIVVGYQEEVATDWLYSRLAALGISDVPHVSGAPFYSFEIWVSREQMELLGREAWVKIIRSVSPPAVLYSL